jgi:hypothetical protein
MDNHMIIIGNDNSNLFNNENVDDDYITIMILVLLSFGDPFLVNTFRKRRWLASASSSGTAAVGRLGYELSCHKIGKNSWNPLRSHGWSQCSFVKLLLYQDHLFLWGVPRHQMSGFDSPGWFLARATSCLAQMPHRCVMRWSQSSSNPHGWPWLRDLKPPRWRPGIPRTSEPTSQGFQCLGKSWRPGLSDHGEPKFTMADHGWDSNHQKYTWNYILL